MSTLIDGITWVEFKHMSGFRVRLQKRIAESEGELKEAYVRVYNDVKRETKRFDDARGSRQGVTGDLRGGRDE